MRAQMKVIGLAGWSGAGKTTLLTRVLPALTQQGLSVSTIKHAHHAFDIDTPGKDSWRHREAGACEVLVASSQRFALMHELREEAEWTLEALLGKMTPVDLVIVEGFKMSPHPRIEVRRAVVGKPWLYPQDSGVVAILADEPPPAGAPPFAHIDDVEAAARLVLAHAQPFDVVRAVLQRHDAQGRRQPDDAAH